MTNPMIQAALITDHQRTMQRTSEEAQRAQAARHMAQPQPTPAQSEQCAPTVRNSTPAMGIQH